MDTKALSLLKKTPCAEHLKRIGLYPHHGIILMLSSLHSQKSCGIGEFLDLIPLFPWLKKIGFDFVQLLPITDSGNDNSPYNPLSTLALNPTFISLHDLEFVQSDPYFSKKLIQGQKENQKRFVNYHKCRHFKLTFLKKYFEKHKDTYTKLEEFKSFKKKHTWLKEYALFNVLCDHYLHPEWDRWAKKHQTLNKELEKELLKIHSFEISFYIFIQFICFRQFKKVKDKAKEKGIYLLGDLPFLVSRHSCDAWSHKELFMRDVSVGSPPDELTPLGQNWDFPAYNWEALKHTQYKWWKVRLKVAEEFFDIYRLDHIIGFYRTWNIPRGKTGADGDFNPKDPSVWLDQGRHFLKRLLDFSQLLPIGEDLVIPQAIIDDLRDLGICGTRILTWQRTGAGGLDFVPYPLYSVASMTHLASHDTCTLAQWWKKYPKVTKQFSQWRNWDYTEHLDRKKREGLLYDSHHTSSLFHANLLQEYLALFPGLVHKEIHLERINYPGTPSKKNWRYRFIPSVEEITQHKELQNALKKILR